MFKKGCIPLYNIKHTRIENRRKNIEKTLIFNDQCVCFLFHVLFIVPGLFDPFCHGALKLDPGCLPGETVD